jgi:hypothetical protein
MNGQPETDSLDALLREQNSYIEDNGFTARVMAALPQRRPRPLRQFFLLGVMAVGWILAVLWLPWGNLPPLDLSSLDSFDSQALWPWVAALSVAASLAWATIAAVQWDD